MRPARPSRPLLLTVLLVASLLAAGCSSKPAASKGDTPLAPVHAEFADAAVANTMAFTRSVIPQAVGTSNDLYEPNLEVSDKGVIYVVAHVAAAVDTGSPAFVSRDDGATWAQLPFLMGAAMPTGDLGSAPPSGDEGYIVPAEDGRAYMADVALHSFPVEGWCDDGATQCYHNPNAYDRAAATTSEGSCDVRSLNDRPWAAYSNHTLLLVNNAGTGAVQVGVLQMPPAPPAGGVEPRPARWNMCAGSGGFIPGIPALRPDHRFVVPQTHRGQQKSDQKMVLVLGNTQDLSEVGSVDAFNLTSTSPTFGGGPRFGGAAFDGTGNLYVWAENNTKKEGWIAVGSSADAGAHVDVTRFHVAGKVGYVHIDGAQNGTGALLTWAQQSQKGDTYADFYAGHLVPSAGGVRLEDVSLVAKDTQPCGDVMGSGVGPDGRGYVVVFSDPAGCLDTPGAHPLSVYVQAKGGPALPGR
jgi:hypothetical protein